MMSTPDEPTDPRKLTSLSELGRNGVERPTKAELDQGLNALYAHISAGKVRQRALMRWSLIGAATVVVVFAIAPILARMHRNTVPTLAYQIEGGSVIEGGYLRESGNAGIKVAFNEGSRLVMLPGTRGRLRAVDRDGARFAIDSGTASFQVTPDKRRQWLVEVGPFVVTVKGTVFSLSWDPPSERFELILREGRVLVSGPVSGGELALRAGQRLVVSLPKAETLITENQSEQEHDERAGNPAPAQSVAAPAASQASATGVSATPDNLVGANPSAGSAPPSVAKEAERGWAAELASGHWDRILESVERNGLETSLNGASSEDLFALANAARYRLRTDIARAALLAYRRRFPNSPRAVDAVFLLGRVEEARGSGMARAIGWYDEYLTKAPTGTYAAEALGRKMTITKEVSGPTQARPLAEEYLRRFPKGSYAGAARALLRAP